jgi:regulator of protease activity HflC (stomatin/prohibitin superfamily)
MPFILFLIAALIFYHYAFQSHTIFQYEKGLRFQKGKFHSLLEPGKYTFYRFNNAVTIIDMRKTTVCVPGQEILTSDNICLKITAGAIFEISDPFRAVTAVDNYHTYLYSLIHMNCRSIMGALTADELMSKRADIAEKLLEATAPAALEAGIKLIDARIRDITFPGELKGIFAKVVAAQKEGQALLERARGESAALRSLANSSKLLDENPNLMQLRLIQALGQSCGHTVVLGGSPMPLAHIPPAAKNQAAPEKKD